MQKQGSCLSGWVAPEQQSSNPKSSSSSSSSSSVFLLPLDPDRWVLASQTPPPVANRPEAKLHPPVEEDKWLLRKKSQAQVLGLLYLLFFFVFSGFRLNALLFSHAGSPVQELLVLPTVCDLFSCLKVGGDKDKWLHRAAEQVSWCLHSNAAVSLTSSG